jgi:hypothetical protein
MTSRWNPKTTTLCPLQKWHSPIKTDAQSESEESELEELESELELEELALVWVRRQLTVGIETHEEDDLAAPFLFRW